MKDKVFNQGIDLLEHNYNINYALDIRFHLWSYIKKSLPTLTDEKFNKIITDLTRRTFAPKLDDIKTELNCYRVEKKQYEEVCGECKKRYKTFEEDEADRECCPDCFNWFTTTPEGIAKNIKRRERLKNKVGILSDSFIYKEPIPETKQAPAVEALPEYPHEF